MKSRRSSRRKRGPRKPRRGTAGGPSSRTAPRRSPLPRRVRPRMAVTLPEGDLQGRLERYLEGLRNRHGLQESVVEGNTVRVIVDPESVPAVLATARESLGGMHLSFITVVDRKSVV